MSRSRGWCFTLNNWTPEERALCEAIECDYIVFGEELAPETGTPHLQGYIYWKTQKTFKAVKKLLGRAHFEPAKGSGDQNKKYCTKGDNIYERGDLPKQGARNDLVALASAVMAGQSVDDLVLENPMAFHQYGRTLERVEHIRQRRMVRTEMTDATWIVAPSGYGKSYYIRQRFPDAYWVQAKDRGWWDNYTGQEVVIWDEYNFECANFQDLLQYANHTPFSVPRRGRAPMPFVAKTFVILSVYEPETMFGNVFGDAELWRQFERRFGVYRLIHWSERVDGALEVIRERSEHAQAGEAGTPPPVPPAGGAAGGSPAPEGWD